MKRRILIIIIIAIADVILTSPSVLAFEAVIGGNQTVIEATDTDDVSNVVERLNGKNYAVTEYSPNSPIARGYKALKKGDVSKLEELNLDTGEYVNSKNIEESFKVFNLQK